MRHLWRDDGVQLKCKEISANRTKMFHVKHFGPIGAENLTRLHTSAALR